MPRPLKPLDPYASWPALFGAAVQQLRLRLRVSPVVSQEELGKRIGFVGSTVSAIERAVLRPDEKFVEGCERELAAEGMLRAMLPLVAAEWEDCERLGITPPRAAATARGHGGDGATIPALRLITSYEELLTEMDEVVGGAENYGSPVEVVGPGRVGGRKWLVRAMSGWPTRAPGDAHGMTEDSGLSD